MTTITFQQWNTLSESVAARRYHTSSAHSESTPASFLQGIANSELAQVFRECASAGWDGYGARAISSATCSRAAAFLNLLPSEMEAPDVVPEADGEVAFEWSHGAHYTFSISVGESGPLNYAGLLGRNREIHGVASFVDRIPTDIFEALSKFFRATVASGAQ